MALHHIVFTLFLSSLFSVNFAQEQPVEQIDWIDIETAQERLKNEPRKLLIDVYTNWCGWCKKMDASTFRHPEIVDYVNKHYYAVKLNAESKQDISFNGETYVNPNPEKKRPTHQLASLAAVKGRLSYPTIVYLDENLQMLSPVPGFLDAKGIEPIIHYFAEEAYKTMAWEEYQKGFKGDIQ